MTVGEAAQALGLKTYDTALPQDWVDDVKRVTGIYPNGVYAFVWCYDVAKTWGAPVALTADAAYLLAYYESEKQNKEVRS